MLNIIFTYDTEVWCSTWQDLDKHFPGAFKKYIYGETKNGDYGLRFNLNILRDFGLSATFFVEPLFATRFGIDPLQEIVGIIKEYNQDIGLHLHTEWVDESREPLLVKSSSKRQFIKQFNLEEQVILIKKGVDLLEKAGCKKIRSFRAGGFGANIDTLKALKINNIKIDSSYNLQLWNKNDISPLERIVQPRVIEGVYEYPMTVFLDGFRKIRHSQLTACSSGEFIYSMNQALKNGWENYIILSHNFELLDQSRTKPDRLVIKRFLKVCKFLEKNSNEFRSIDFGKVTLVSFKKQPDFIKVKPIRTIGRILEQGLRRLSR
jgi:hypothetical protein